MINSMINMSLMFKKKKKNRTFEEKLKSLYPVLSKINQMHSIVQ